MAKRIQKDPQAVLDYRVDWSAWLAGDTIVASTWILETGITNDLDTYNATTAVIWLSGGTLGEIYTVTNRITTALGRIDDRTFLVEIKNK
jgi:hypothetical protein